MASPQYVYVMNKLSKTYPGGKQVLKDMTLAFLPGAKIGVVGVNGAGKSTLLRIMAGEETEFLGEAWAADGVRVGYLAQEPKLDPAKDVIGNVMEGVAEKKAKLDRYNELAVNYSDETADEMAAAAGRDRRAATPGTSTPRSSRPWRRCAARPATPRSIRSRAARSAAWRCAASCCRSPTSSCSTSRPTISTPKPSRGSSTILRDYPGHRGHGHPRPLLPRQRHRMDARARSRGAASPIKGNYSVLARAEAEAARVRRKAGRGEGSGSLHASSTGSGRAPRRARRSPRPASRAYDDLLAKAGLEQTGKAQITIPPGPRLGDMVIEATHLQRASAIGS